MHWRTRPAASAGAAKTPPGASRDSTSRDLFDPWWDVPSVRWEKAAFLFVIRFVLSVLFGLAAIVFAAAFIIAF